MPKIVDVNGNPIDSGVLKEPQTAGVVQLANTYLTPMLDGLTPARLAAHLHAADMGDLTIQARLFSDMEERDTHLAAEMGKRKMAVMGLPWDIVPPRNATAKEKADAEWVKEMLTDAVDPIEDLILALMDGVGHGYSPVELEWRQEDGQLLPAFFPRPQEWLRLSQNRHELRLIDGSPDGSPLKSFGWAVHTHGKAKTGYLGRLGLYRVLSWPFLYKAYAIGDFAEFLETFGLPIIMGKYYSGALPEEKASLMRAVTALGHDARAIMPTDMQIEIAKVSGSGGDATPHLAMVGWADESISKGILGQILSSGTGQHGGGSYALGKVHDGVREDIRNADARQIGSTITRDVIYSMLALNRGVDSLSRCCRLVFDTGEPDDLKALAEGVKGLVDAGVTTIPVAWVHEKGRIPMPGDGEATIGAAQTPPKDSTQNGKSVSLAALTANGTDVISDQDTLDAALDAMPPEAMQALMDRVLSPLLSDLGKAGGYERAMAVLSSRYPSLDAAKLEELMARAMFVSELLGAAGNDV